MLFFFFFLYDNSEVRTTRERERDSAERENISERVDVKRSSRTARARGARAVALFETHTRQVYSRVSLEMFVRT